MTGNFWQRLRQIMSLRCARGPIDAVEQAIGEPRATEVSRALINEADEELQKAIKSVSDATEIILADLVAKNECRGRR